MQKYKLPEPDALVRPHEYDKFHALFEAQFPRPKKKSKLGPWKFKREMAWRGWQYARKTPYQQPVSTLTMCSISPLTPDYLIEMAQSEPPTI